MTRIAVFWAAALVAGLLFLSACGGGDDGSGDEAPVAADETPTAEVTPIETEMASAATDLPELETLCDLVTADDIEEAVGDSVTDTTEFGLRSCGYTLATGSTVNIEQGSTEDFEVGVFRTGDLGEPVTGVADQAAWFPQELAVLAVGQGEFYFQIRLNLPEVESAAELEIATELAEKAVQRLP